jgi:glycosyltransferase involved in cell wall biosynthesis
MKVCFIVGTLGRGGAEKQLVFMLRALKLANIEARVLCLTSGESYEAEIKSLGVEVEFIGEKQNRLWRLWKIIRNLRNRPADIIQSSHFYTNIYAALAGKALGIPSIGAIRSNLTSELTINKSLGKFQISLPSFLIANSDLARRTAIERGIAPDKIEFVRNVVEVELNESEIAPKSKENITFLFVGRLGKEKRPDRFVRLAAALIEKFPELPLRFQIAGDGVLRTEIEAQIKSCNLPANKFELLGECAKMNEVYRQADALVLTSDYEGTPNVVLEAMAHALPVIATKVGGTPEILNEQCGFLVKPDDESGLLKAAVTLIENPELRSNLGFEGFQNIKNNHSLSNLTNHLTEIYDGLVNPVERELTLKRTLAQKTSSRF